MKLNYFLVLFYLNTIYCLPQIRVRPQSNVLLSSSEVRLTCESTDTPFLSVAYWTYIGQRIEPNPSIIEMHGNDLQIFHFGDTAYTQPGAYACVVSTRYGLLESEPAMLSLPTLDSFKAPTNEMNILNITEGNTAVIPCELPAGNPRPIPIFSLDNNRIEIEANSNRFKILSSGNLHIIEVEQYDSGRYQCSAKNPLTGQIVNNTQTTLLQVFRKPLNKRERQAITTVYKPAVASRVLVGDNYSIECVVAGWPIPIVEWEKYGDVLPERRSEVLHGTLHLYNIRLDDRGTYICRASNSNGHSDIAYTALLEVLEPPKVIQRPDSLIQISKDDTVSIKCGFRGRPEPVINWLYNGQELILNGAPVTDGTLLLNQPKEGIYQCIGRNAYGVAQANVALVLKTETNSEEKLESEQPIKQSLIVIGPNNVTVYEGETVQLHCLTQTGSTVQWLHNSRIINLNSMRRYEMLPSGGLRIVSAQKSDSGIYECIASKIGSGINTAKCFVYVHGLGTNIPVSKLEIVKINQINNNGIKLFWKINETIENSLSFIQIQYRSVHSKTSWLTADDFYNRTLNQAIINNLQENQVYKFRLIGLDNEGKQIVISAAKRFTLEQNVNQINSSVIEITDAWITNDEQITLKWKLMNNANSETIDGFVVYYRPINSKRNFTTVTIPNLRYPSIDSYTISSIEPDQIYELRMATYSNRGLSPMSKSIEITVPTLSKQHRPRVNQIQSTPDIDEILENLTKVQNSVPIKPTLAAPIVPSTQKSSNILYLTIGIITGILLILMIILIVMSILRLLQRKKIIAHIKSNNNSEYYCDGMNKSLNPNYATTPCLQHGVVSVDGKLIPFTYPTNTKPPKIYCHSLKHTPMLNDNNPMNLNTNPLNRLDNENIQENFYHTLTPFNSQSQYEDCQSLNYARNQTTVLFERPSCPIHHQNRTNENSSTLNEIPCHHIHYNQTTYQQQSNLIRKPILSDVNTQQHDVCDRIYVSLSTNNGGHFCAHLPNDSTQQKSRIETFKHSAPLSTDSSSHSSSGISSTMDSPYNHWKYLTPISIGANTANETPSSS